MAYVHIWYRISSRYLSEKDIYNLIMAYPQFSQFQICQRKYSHYVWRNSFSCKLCTYRCACPLGLRAHIKKMHKVRWMKYMRVLQML